MHVIRGARRVALWSTLSIWWCALALRRSVLVVVAALAAAAVAGCTAGATSPTTISQVISRNGRALPEVANAVSNRVDARLKDGVVVEVSVG
jgi:hypothetical protein